MGDTFVHGPIGGPSYIRLLDLQPGSGSLHFTLRNVSLDTDPKYEAISYCWGEPSHVQEAFCDGKRLSITNSLYTALCRLRRPDRIRVLWADAVCINQGDLDERTSQVQLMSRIYSNPTRVLIWLGEDTSDLDGIYDSIAQALEVLPVESYDDQVLQQSVMGILAEAESLRKQGKRNLLDVNWAPIANLLCRPWFMRKWVIQEVIVAGPNVPRTMLCGGLEIAWADVASITFRIAAHGLLVVLNGWTSFISPGSLTKAFTIRDALPCTGLHNAQIILMIDHYRDTGCLLDCILATEKFQCTDPRDQIYALLSIPRNQELKARYEISTEELYKQFTEHMLTKEGGNLDVLGLAPHGAVPRPGKPVKRLNLPTWVPDLSVSRDSNPLVGYSVRGQIFSAGGSEVPKVTVSPCRGLLHLRGRIVDHVQKLVPLLPDADSVYTRTLNSKRRDPVRDLVQRCALTVSGGGWASLSGQQRRDLVRTLMCDMTLMRDALPEDVLDGVTTYMEKLLSMEEGDDLSGLSESDMKYGLIAEQSIIIMGGTKRFCVTEHGRFGVVSLWVEPGDRFCVFSGAKLPLVIRPTVRDTFSLLGEGVLMGVMYGEALRDDGCQEIDVTLE